MPTFINITDANNSTRPLSYLSTYPFDFIGTRLSRGEILGLDESEYWNEELLSEDEVKIIIKAVSNHEKEKLNFKNFEAIKKEQSDVFRYYQHAKKIGYVVSDSDEKKAYSTFMKHLKENYGIIGSNLRYFMERATPPYEFDIWTEKMTWHTK